MSATNHTSLGLPQYILDDDPEMQDFNGAFEIIDQKLVETGNNVAGLSETVAEFTETISEDVLAINAAKIDKTAIVNDLTTGGATNVLSAQQGVILQAAKADQPYQQHTQTDGGFYVEDSAGGLAKEVLITGFGVYPNCLISGDKIKFIGKNEFDGISIFNSYFGITVPISSESDKYRTIYARCLPNVAYTISKTAGQRFIIGYTDQVPAIGVQPIGTISNPTGDSISITTGSDAKYLVAWIYNSDYDTAITAEEMLASVQIEKGTSATAREDYIVSSEITLPTNLESGDTWDVFAGKVTRSGGGEEPFDVQKVELEQGTAQAICYGDNFPAEISILYRLKLQEYIKNVYDGQLVSTTANESASLGDELMSSSGWTLGEGWSGSFDAGFVHTPGQTGALTKAMGSTGTKKYLVTLTLISSLPASEPGFFTIQIGNSGAFQTYRGGGTTFTYELGIQSVSDGDLSITPISSLDGTISAISVKEVVETFDPAFKMVDSQGESCYEIRPTIDGLKNIFVGKNSGYSNVKGDGNVSVGYEALKENVAGYWNVAAGLYALNKNVQGSRNIALGYSSLRDNISGFRNIAIGSFSLSRNTTGGYNVALGSDNLWYNTTGNQNIAIGHASLNLSTTGNDNVAIGVNSMKNLAVGNSNVAIGYGAGYGASGMSGEYNVFIGRSAGRLTTSGSRNLLIGWQAGDNITSGSDNICIGRLTTISSGDSNNELNIGNAITGNLSTKIITMENLILSNLPTADPHVAGQIWNNSNSLSISAG